MASPDMKDVLLLYQQHPPIQLSTVWGKLWSHENGSGRVLSDVYRFV